MLLESFIELIFQGATSQGSADSNLEKWGAGLQTPGGTGTYIAEIRLREVSASARSQYKQ